MKRTVAFLLSLMLLLPLTVILTAASDPVLTQSVSTGEVLTAPESLPSGKVFAGWGAEGIFLPAGATYTGEGTVTLTAVLVGMSTRPDTKVRTEVQTGLRFLTDIDKADLNVLKGYTEVLYGTYIAPADYVTAANGVLTSAALQSAGKTCLETVTDKLYAETETTATVAGSLVELLTHNYYRDFQAAGYLKVSYTNGTAAVVVASASAPVKLYDLSLSAYCDRTEAADATHVSVTDHGTYSPYNADQLGYFAKVMDCVVDVTRFTVDIANNDVVKPSEDFYGYMPQSYRVTYELGCYVFTVEEGGAFRFNKDLGAVYAIRNEERKQISPGRNTYQVLNDGRALNVVQPVDGYSGQH